jgi:hypothetical protein
MNLAIYLHGRRNVVVRQAKIQQACQCYKITIFPNHLFQMNTKTSTLGTNNNLRSISYLNMQHLNKLYAF